MQGYATHWWNSLPTEVKTSYELVSAKFTSHYGAAGSDKVAVDELNALKQGKEKSSDINASSGLGIGQQVNQPVATAPAPGPMMDSPTPMEDVEQNAQQFQPFQNRASKTKYKKSSNQANSSSATPRFKGKCHACGLIGHKAAKCRSVKNNTQSVQSPSTKNRHGGEGEYECSLFDRLVQNTTTIVKTVNTADINSRRFLIDVYMGNRKVSALVDTGSMITSISSKLAQECQLQYFPTVPLSIEYGNSSRSKSDTEVHETLTIQKTDYQVVMRVVEKQNMEMILGMDWLCHN
ncbi:hypothetical protein CLU79DRAFT_724165 [Phycomyces nitens]|nr:hypothetical protein CLU79DRAFT_724165 [Phycomyces nitens]